MRMTRMPRSPAPGRQLCLPWRLMLLTADALCLCEHCVCRQSTRLDGLAHGIQVPQQRCAAAGR